MVILSSAIAVVVAAVLLLLWVVVDGGVALIYAAMACAVLSMVLLQLGTRLGNARHPGSDHLPSPDLLAGSRPAAPAPAPAAAPAAAEVDPTIERFPIADYDSLWVSQIVALVAALDVDALAAVEARERRGRARSAVLEAVATARPQPEAERPEPEADPEPEPEPEPDADPDAAPDALPGTEVAAAEAEVARRFGPDDGWDGMEPDQWDWSGVRGTGSGRRSGWPDPPVPDGLDADLAADQAGVAPNEVATVRLFLGRRRSPVTVRRT